MTITRSRVTGIDSEKQDHVHPYAQVLLLSCAWDFTLMLEMILLKYAT